MNFSVDPDIINIYETWHRTVKDRDLAQWYRTGTLFVNGHQLVWEYPRNAPQGEQTDLIEMMEIKNGLIAYHRVYWGWYGVRLLAPALQG
ncbi:hypothetical protein I7969_004257 [Salmonella enterica]|nr:hypothetical protein [Salmonella enterica]